MGTNYYLESYIHLPKQEPVFVWYALHIGKRSAGWVFAFRGYPELKITCLADWVELITEGESENATRIVDEYGNVDTMESFFELVHNTKQPQNDGNPPWNHGYEYPTDGWTDDQDFPFSETDFS